MFKFELGQLVYYIEDNKLHSSPVLSRIIVENKTESDNADEFYMRFGKSRIIYSTCHGEYEEGRLFASKEDLAKSIIGE